MGTEKEREGVVNTCHACIVALVGASSVASAQFYADVLADSMDVTFFGSGDLTGAPDGGGAYLSLGPDGAGAPLGYLTLGWTGGLTTGAGIDLQIFDVSSSFSETADVSVSVDGVSFTYVGSIDAVNNQLDIDPFFSGGFNFVRIDNPDPDSIIDIDAVAGFYVPSPSGVALLGLAGVAGLRRRR